MKFLRLMSLVVSWLMVGGSSDAVAAVSAVRFDEHRITVRLDVSLQRAQIRDEGKIEVTEGWNVMYLNPTAVIDSFTLQGQAVETITAMPADTRASIP